MIWTGVENVDPTGIRCPERPVRHKSIYRLSYPGPTDFDGTFHNQLEATAETSMPYLYFLMHARTHRHTCHAVKFCLPVHLSLHKFQNRDLLVFDSIETGLLPKRVTEKRVLFASGWLSVFELRGDSGHVLNYASNIRLNAS